MRIAGIDYGTVRIGIAVADTSVGIATPYETYTRRNEEADRQYFVHLVGTENIDRFVIGLPVHLDGRESQKSIEAREFGYWIDLMTGVPIEFFDERFTSAEAEQMLGAAKLTKKQRQARRDKIAAQIMLTAYLESGGRGDDAPGGID